MIGRQWLLVQRELWEHKALYYAPLAVAGLIVFGFVVSFITAVAQGVSFDVAVATLELTGAPVSITGGGTLMLIPFGFLNAVLGVVVFLYGIDALYAERKDKSILFWRSVTDTETVVSKLVTAMLAAPIVTAAIIIATQIVLFVLATLVVLIGGGSPGELLFGPLPFLQIWMLMVWVLVTSAIWFAPVIAWFLFCSAFARRSVLIWVFVPWIVVFMLEGIVLRSTSAWRVVTGRFADAAISGLSLPFSLEGLDDEEAVKRLIQGGDLDILAAIAPGKFLAQPGLWGGLVVAAVFIAGAIYYRRFRS